MPKHPELPLEARAAIERARKHIRAHAAKAWPLLLLDVPPGRILPIPLEREPATLQVQIQEFFKALFDDEAKHCVIHSDTDDQLHSWLVAAAKEIQKYVLRCTDSEDHNYHCSRTARKFAVKDSADSRIEHWMNKTKWPLAIIAERQRRIFEGPQSQPSGRAKSTVIATRSNIADLLDQACVSEKIPQKEQIERIRKLGISRSTYFAIRSGRGGKRSRAIIDDYLKHVFHPSPSKSSD